jgi:ABC-type molybdate transport system substrate-binding protein
MKRVHFVACAVFIAACALATPFLPGAESTEPTVAILPSPGTPRPCGTVTVAAASDLNYAMNEIVANFQKETGCVVHVSMGSSGNFLTQIENGAPFDVFFSADIAYPKKLESDGLVPR